MARAPSNDSSSRKWNEDTATVIFGDDLVEDFLPGPDTENTRSSAPRSPVSGVQHSTGSSALSSRPAPLSSRAPSALPPPSIPRAPSVPASMLRPPSNFARVSAGVSGSSVLLPPAPGSGGFERRRTAPPTLPSPGLASAVRAPRTEGKVAAPSSRGWLFRIRRFLAPKSRADGQDGQSSSPPNSAYSGLDSLRPYVGTHPQILAGNDFVEASQSRARAKVRDALFRGFAWGVAVASLLFVTLTLFARFSSPPGEGRQAAARVHLDADSILSRTQPDKTQADRAASGEREALFSLKKKPASSLSPEEAAAISRGEEVRASAHAKAAVEALAKQRSFSPADKAEFFRHAGSQRTFREALVAMATNKSEAGPDLIYQVMRTYRHQADIADFARAILVSPQVYKYASPALTVVIDAETISECSEVRQLLDRTLEDGDVRAVRHMAKFAKTTGCGEHGIHDCYSCLRSDRALVDALRAAQARRAP